MDIYKQKFTKLQQDIISFLFMYAGQSFNGRSIARKLRVSPTAVSKALKKLKEENLIKVEKDKETKRLSIKLNRENKKIFELKRIENLKLIYESGIVDFLEEKFPGNTIILFGSYSKGEDVWTGESEEHNSDIDIAIIGSKEKQIDLTKFDKFFQRIVFLHFYDSLNKIDKNLRSNILSGITLIGVGEI